MNGGDSASPRSVRRSRRPQTRLETSCTRTGRPRRHRSPNHAVASLGERTFAFDGVFPSSKMPLFSGFAYPLLRFFPPALFHHLPSAAVAERSPHSVVDAAPHSASIFCSGALSHNALTTVSGVENRRSSGSLPVAFVSAAFAGRASVRFGMALFPVPAHRTGQAHLAHPALGEKFTVSPTESCLSE